MWWCCPDRDPDSRLLVDSESDSGLLVDSESDSGSWSTPDSDADPGSDVILQSPEQRINRYN